MKNKIGWCSMTWNPVWGCRNRGCPYCYARTLAKRFGKMMAMAEYDPHSYSTPSDDKTDKAVENLSNELKKFIPNFLYRQYHKKLPEVPQRIFVGSMSEIYYWEEEWMERVLNRVKGYPQHIFMFLTQYPEVYARYLFGSNCWLGVTVTKNEPIKSKRSFCISKKKTRFLSIEPILEKINIEHIDDFEPDWIIVGAETGNRKSKVIPKKEWIEVIIDFCNRTNRPIYIKDNLTKYFPEFESMKEFPKIKNNFAK